MSTTMKPPASNKTSPCGCGKPGGTCGCSGSCTCTPSACDACPEGAYIRPRFFAGQLLTEEDLQLLTQYTVEKNRLHNRYFWGDGVSCGLEVTADPCEPAVIHVSSGYALDCCGNDIVVPCPQRIDIRPMLRDLRLREGKDCGDPCEEEQAQSPGRPGDLPPTTNPSNTPTAPSGVPGGLPDRPTPQPPPAPRPERRYCLYIHYCEKESDPVMPYSTGDQCGGSPCEATRVKEGFSFELRCSEPHEPGSPLLERLCKCVKKDEKNSRDTAAQYFRDSAERWSAAAAALQPNFTPPFDETAFSTSVQKVTAVTAPTSPFTPADAAAFRSDLATAARYTAAWFYLDPESELREKYSNQVRQFASLAQKLPSILEARKLDASDPYVAAVQRAETAALVTGVAGLFRTEGRMDLQSSQMLLLASGIPSGAAYEAALDSALPEAVRGLALQAQTVSRYGSVSPRAIQSLPLAPAVLSTREAASRFVMGVGAYANLRNALDRECECAAILPSCPECEDTGVLLACFSYEDCRVANVCNLERRFLLTPVNLRYWFPLNLFIGPALELLCCPSDSKMAAARPNAYITAIARYLRLYQELLSTLCGSGRESRMGSVAAPLPDLDRFRPALDPFGRAFEPDLTAAETFSPESGTTEDQPSSADEPGGTAPRATRKRGGR